ncbi:MAG: hypothetical protein WD898_00290 [Candidatus Paceibacterota bacterium]
MIELNNFGWNSMTLSFLGTLFFSFWTAWAAFGQNKLIWRNRSGKAVSSTTIFYGLCLQTAAVIYGYDIHSLAVLVGGLIRIPLLTMTIIGLGRFKGFSKKEKFMFSLSLSLLVGMLFLSSKGKMFMVFAFGSVLAYSCQLFELWLSDTTGVIDIRVVLVALCSSIFWMVYGISIDDVVIKIVSPCFLAISCLIIVLWFRKPKEAP